MSFIEPSTSAAQLLDQWLAARQARWGLPIARWKSDNAQQSE
jgi:hypothetical protein